MHEIQERIEQFCSEHNYQLLQFIPNCTKVFVKIGRQDKSGFNVTVERNFYKSKVGEDLDFYMEAMMKHLNKQLGFTELDEATKNSLRKYIKKIEKDE